MWIVSSAGPSLRGYLDNPSQSCTHKVSHLLEIQLVYSVCDRVAVKEAAKSANIYELEVQNLLVRVQIPIAGAIRSEANDWVAFVVERIVIAAPILNRLVSLITTMTRTVDLPRS